MESEHRSERTKAGLARALREGERLGRPKGSKDKGKRRRMGYLLRYADRQKTGIEKRRTFFSSFSKGLQNSK